MASGPALPDLAMLCGFLIACLKALLYDVLVRLIVTVHDMSRLFVDDKRTQTQLTPARIRVGMEARTINCRIRLCYLAVGCSQHP